MNRRTFIRAALAAAALTAARCRAESARLVCYGDSITVGLGASTRDRSYVARIGAATGWVIDNRAINGTTIAEQLARELQPTPPDTTDRVLILTGYNDMRGGTSLDDYRAGLRAALALLRRAARVYVGNCLRITAAGYAAYGPKWDHGSDELVAAYNGVIADEVRAAGATLVDASAAYDPANVTRDLVHPNDAGHAQIAGAFLAAMQPRVYVPLVLT